MYSLSRSIQHQTLRPCLATNSPHKTALTLFNKHRVLRNRRGRIQVNIPKKITPNNGQILPTGAAFQDASAPAQECTKKEGTLLNELSQTAVTRQLDYPDESYSHLAKQARRIESYLVPSLPLSKSKPLNLLKIQQIGRPLQGIE